MDFGALREGPGGGGHDADVANVAEEGEENGIEKLAAPLTDRARAAQSVRVSEACGGV